MKIIFFIFSFLLVFPLILLAHEAPLHVVEPLTQTISKFIGLGFIHIIPMGLDHILFVLGLYLASNNWKDLFVQVSAFTMAHTITLALVVLGIFSLPTSVVEPIIAISIAAIGIENIVFKKPPKWRGLIVFAFGLIHGMGFAGVLHEIGLPEKGFWTALLSFNVGVEFGQLMVIGVAFSWTVFFIKLDGYRKYVVIPGSVIISLFGLICFIQRLLPA